MFNPHLEIGQIIKNPNLVSIFKCGNMGGMRRSRETNTLVIVSDYTKGIYHDKRATQ
jgi:5-methylcytosine-specific restriction enzyme A